MSRAREALRQQIFLRALWRDARPGVLQGWARDGEHFARGLQVYRANAGALAERALAAVYPTLQLLLGAESFAALAQAFWHAHPPARGDIAQWGAAMATFIGVDPQLASEPYLSDVARLEWAVHIAQGAADSAGPPRGLELLGAHDPSGLWLLAQPGTALVPSAHPVVSIWQAHRPQAQTRPDRFAALRASFSAGRAEPALVWRSGWQVQVVALTPAEAGFTQAVLQGQSLGTALAAAAEPDSFDFEHWLLSSLRRGWLAGARASRATPASPEFE